jgi:hypothetical protein
MKTMSVFTSLGLLFLSFTPMVLQAQESEKPRITLPEVEVLNYNEDHFLINENFHRLYGESHKPFVWADNDFFLFPKSKHDPDIITYTIKGEASNGSTLYVIYSHEGKLLKSKEVLRNFTPAEPIINTLRNIEHKGWIVKKNVSIRKITNDGVMTERNYLRLEKGKNKKILCLDENGRRINGTKDEIAELDR